MGTWFSQMVVAKAGSVIQESVDAVFQYAGVDFFDQHPLWSAGTVGHATRVAFTLELSELERYVLPLWKLARTVINKNTRRAVKHMKGHIEAG